MNHSVQRVNEEEFTTRYPGARDDCGRLIEKEGILLKRGSKWPRLWKERHIVLRGSLLEYYALEKGLPVRLRARQSFKLQPDTICQQTECGSYTHCFKVFSRTSLTH